jgi:hypothetical protein
MNKIHHLNSFNSFFFGVETFRSCLETILNIPLVDKCNIPSNIMLNSLKFKTLGMIQNLLLDEGENKQTLRIKGFETRDDVHRN